MKKFKHICNGIIWTLIVLYLLLIVLMHLPSVQTFLGKEVAEALADKFGTKVEVGKVNLGFFNRIIIDDVMMYDQQGDSLIYASRLSAKIDYMAATQGKISVSSAQIFGLRANLYRQTAKSPANFQFVLDSLASSTSLSTCTSEVSSSAEAPSPTTSATWLPEAASSRPSTSG